MIKYNLKIDDISNGDVLLNVMTQTLVIVILLRDFTDLNGHSETFIILMDMTDFYEYTINHRSLHKYRKFCDVTFD